MDRQKMRRQVRTRDKREEGKQERWKGRKQEKGS